MLQCLKFFHKHVLLLTNFHNITFLSSIVWHNLSSSSIVSVVPLYLVAFSASSWSSLSQCIFKRVDIFRATIFRIIFPCALANQSLCTSPLSETVLNHWLPSANNSTFLSTFLHGPSMPCFGQKLSVWCYLQFLFWYNFLWLLFLCLREITFPLKSFSTSLQHTNITFQFDNI